MQHQPYDMLSTFVDMVWRTCQKTFDQNLVSDVLKVCPVFLACTTKGVLFSFILSLSKSCPGAAPAVTLQSLNQFRQDRIFEKSWQVLTTDCNDMSYLQAVDCQDICWL